MTPNQTTGSVAGLILELLILSSSNNGTDSLHRIPGLLKRKNYAMSTHREK
jgi:hypothetical protein